MARQIQDRKTVIPPSLSKALEIMALSQRFHLLHSPSGQVLIPIKPPGLTWAMVMTKKDWAENEKQNKKH